MHKKCYKSAQVASAVNYYTVEMFYVVINKLFQQTNTDNIALHEDYMIKFITK
jgi:hypothetical protein